MKKLVLAIVYFMLSSAAFAGPTAICSGPDSVIDTDDDGQASALYTVRKSYDYHDHNLETAITDWELSGDGCASLSPPQDNVRGGWDYLVRFNVNPYEPSFCTITVEVTDGSTSTCSINVRVAPHCETSSGDPDCIGIPHVRNNVRR